MDIIQLMVELVIQELTLGNDPNNPIPPKYTKYNEPVSGGIEYFDIITQKIYLDGDDQKLFKMCPKLDYLIEINQIGNQEIITNPTKRR